MHEDALPAWLVPYAERMLARYPEVFLSLGNPGLTQSCHLPPACGSAVEIKESARQKTIRVHLRHRVALGAPAAPCRLPGLDALGISTADIGGIVGAAAAPACHPVATGNGTSAVAPCPPYHPPQPSPCVAEGAAAGHSQEWWAEPESPRSPGNYKPWAGTLQDQPAWQPRSVWKSLSGRYSAELSQDSECGNSKLVAPAYSPDKPSTPQFDATPVNDVFRPPPRSGAPQRMIGVPHLADSDVSSPNSEYSCSASFGPLPACHDAAPGSTHANGTPSSQAAPSLNNSPNGQKITAGGLRARRGLALKLGGRPAAPQPPSPVGEEPSKLPVHSNFLEPPAMPMMRRDSLKYSSMGSDHLRPENQQPAVQLLVSRAKAPVDRHRRKHTSEDKDNSPITQPLPRPLPGAFPCRRTVFFFDWDDTLCPTAWIRSLLKETLADMEEWAEGVEPGLGCPDVDWRDEIPSWFNQPLPDEPAVHESIAALQQAVINVINVAQSLGVVCIVTNAVPGWVEKTMKRWLPQLKQYVWGHGSRPPITVLYGQQAYVRSSVVDLPWLDELGEYMWWKKAAMNLALDEVEDLYRLKEGPSQSSNGRAGSLPCMSWCASSDAKRIANLISIGDNEAEMQAAQLAGCVVEDRRSRFWQGQQDPRCSILKVARRGSFTRTSSAATAARGATGVRPGSPLLIPRKRHNSEVAPRLSHWPWVKLVKLRECSHVRQLRVQLEEVAELLPQMVALRKHLRVDFSRDGPHTPRSGKELQPQLLKCSNSELGVEQFLRVQTV